MCKKLFLSLKPFLPYTTTWLCLHRLKTLSSRVQFCSIFSMQKKETKNTSPPLYVQKKRECETSHYRIMNVNNVTRKTAKQYHFRGTPSKSIMSKRAKGFSSLCNNENPLQWKLCLYFYFSTSSLVFKVKASLLNYMDRITNNAVNAELEGSHILYIQLMHAKWKENLSVPFFSSKPFFGKAGWKESNKCSRTSEIKAKTKSEQGFFVSFQICFIV